MAYGLENSGGGGGGGGGRIRISFNILYLKPPYLYNIVIKNCIWKNFRGGGGGGGAPGAPPSKSALGTCGGQRDSIAYGGRMYSAWAAYMPNL